MDSKIYNALKKGTRVKVNLSDGRVLDGVICKRFELGRKYQDYYNVVSVGGYTPVYYDSKLISLADAE